MKSYTWQQYPVMTQIGIHGLNVGTSVHMSHMCFAYCISTCPPQNDPYLLPPPIFSRPYVYMTLQYFKSVGLYSQPHTQGG